MIRSLKAATSYILDLIFPKRCVSCGAHISFENDFLCRSCRNHLNSEISEGCLGCGKPYNKCRCKPSFLCDNTLITTMPYKSENSVCRELIIACKRIRNRDILNELDINGWLIKFLLRDGSTLRKVVTLAGESDDRLTLQKGARRRVNFDEAKFYIAEENKKRAESMQKSAIKWYLLPVFCALSIGIAIGVHYLIPVFQNW